MAKRGIVPDCPLCDIGPDGAEDGNCCTVIFCHIHSAAGLVASQVRVEATIMARLARDYRAEVRMFQSQGYPEAASSSRRIAGTYRRAFQRLLQIVRLSKPKPAGVPA